ncbi:hypothetical protein NGB78_07350 [Staphylococcus arlettae]|uniref:UPF0738 protein NCTC12413_01947 n=2 Tax=Staphylococcus arlettae TaxID=29378 RepID=A0A380CM12_9STAP|nr:MULTISPECIES: hypothetical protein [Staphylococcus]EJY95578.1 hypothetical protein SARL_07174 [Staphylococcus arlettae CVD059]ERF49719.1 hypothetical protein N039_08310 [Staphylococcus sp. EGD-HP3]KAB2481128.1 hypothetical protein F9B39_02335 [Staphylococcus sp. CH99b_3]MBF0737281.1 hypothetical protein [Staphylococcus arlettae]MBK3718715.1 hypothetical protein [Staphylococcus arlettae]
MRIYVNEIKITDDSILCYTEESIEGLQEAGQMLVDSDNHAFAHILDNGESYTYLIFVQETWSMLHENKGKKIIVNDTLELTEFNNELTYILENIKGNSNYGKEFVSVVEDTFELE